LSTTPPDKIRTKTRVITQLKPPPHPPRQTRPKHPGPTKKDAHYKLTNRYVKTENQGVQGAHERSGLVERDLSGFIVYPEDTTQSLQEIRSMRFEETCAG
ncbi:hypothetical protein ACKVEX_15650, partial [Rhodocyclaceae bacterium SMB388]